MGGELALAVRLGPAGEALGCVGAGSPQCVKCAATPCNSRRSACLRHFAWGCRPGWQAGEYCRSWTGVRGGCASARTDYDRARVLMLALRQRVGEAPGHAATGTMREMRSDPMQQSAPRVPASLGRVTLVAGRPGRIGVLGPACLSRCASARTDHDRAGKDGVRGTAWDGRGIGPHLDGRMREMRSDPMQQSVPRVPAAFGGDAPVPCSGESTAVPGQSCVDPGGSRQGTDGGPRGTAWGVARHRTAASTPRRAQCAKCAATLCNSRYCACLRHSGRASPFPVARRAPPWLAKCAPARMDRDRAGKVALATRRGIGEAPERTRDGKMREMRSDPMQQSDRVCLRQSVGRPRAR